MPMTERLDDVTEVRQWVDSIPFHYEYTAGVAGEKFLRGLIDGKILAAYCPNCKEAALPARMYCVDCYGETTKLIRVDQVGVVKAITRTGGGAGERVAFAFIEFPEVKGGIVHRLIGSARAGSRVKAKFRPKLERTGAISDVLGFERTD
ncbi:MAG: cobalt transporter ApaG [Thaumarchaeota archaeon]|nr:cobalt transporter ApaG [Nitrososphaerota archaeon]